MFGKDNLFNGGGNLALSHQFGLAEQSHAPAERARGVD
jgi:hypothetical protein